MVMVQIAISKQCYRMIGADGCLLGFRGGMRWMPCTRLAAGATRTTGAAELTIDAALGVCLS